MVGQTEKFRQFAVIQSRKLAIVAKQFLQNDKCTDFIEVNPDKDETTKEVHALAVAHLGTVLGVGCKNIVEGVLLFFDWRDERCDATGGECSFDIEGDLLLVFEVVNCALCQVKSVIKVSLVEAFVALLNVLAADAHNQRPCKLTTLAIR